MNICLEKNCNNKLIVRNKDGRKSKTGIGFCSERCNRLYNSTIQFIETPWKVPNGVGFYYNTNTKFFAAKVN